MSLSVETATGTGTNPWWHVLVACPSCGSSLSADPSCARCGASPVAVPYGLVWPSDAPQESSRAVPGRLLKTLRYYLTPWSNPGSPLKLLTRYRLDRFYARTVSDKALAEDWCTHYLGGLGLVPGDKALDHGCGRGRNTGLMLQSGFHVAAQDITAHPWWSQLPDSGFQVAPAMLGRLPWRDNSFSLLTDFGVIGHLSSADLSRFVAEVFRVLKPGGIWVILEANSRGWGARGPRRHYGRLHDLEGVLGRAEEAGLKQVDHWYEGFNSPVASLTINFLRKQCSLRTFDLSDYGSWLSRLLPEHRRVQWVLRLRKPEKI